MNNIEEYPPGFDLFNETGGAGAQEVQETGAEQDNDTADAERIPDSELFGEPTQESVGGDEDKEQGQGNPPAETGEGEDSSADFYSSVASAMRQDGVLEYLNDEDIAAVTDADSFRAAMEREISMRYDEGQRELMEAMGYGADVGELAQLQQTIGWLDSIDPQTLGNDGDEQAAQLRKDLISGYYSSLGMSPEQVAREVKKSLDAGTDIEDAKAALEQQRGFFRSVYDGRIQEAKRREDQRRLELENRQRTVSERIMNSEEPISGLRVDKRIREKALENMYSPTVKGADGRYYTKVQAYQMEHPDEFLQAVGLLYTLTDGFTSFDKVVAGAVRREKNKNIKNLESVLRSRQGGGNGLSYVANGRGDSAGGGSRYTVNV